MRNLRAMVLGVAFAVACSGGGQASFNVISATADESYWCPGNSTDAAYDVHANVHLRNGTSSAVSITSVTAGMTLEAGRGAWLEKVGDKYDAGNAQFTPASVAAVSDANLKVTFRSSCTSPAYGGSGFSYGDYRVTLHLGTSAGSYSISVDNLHRIFAA